LSKYEILYDQSFPLVRYNLNAGESIKAEADAMVAMSATIDVTGGVERGILSGLGRMLSGEKFFFQYLKATRGPGQVLFAHSYPGGITDVVLDGSYGMNVQKDGFLAATDSVEVSTKVQSLFRGLFSREGFFILKVNGRGTVFLSSYGAIHPIELKDGEQLVVDNGHLVAWPDYMTYTIEKSSKSWISSWMSGETLVCRFTGPGLVLIQSRNPDAFKAWVKKAKFLSI
jgi:uncharacterized protein (TIGR00266 family)